MDVHRFFVGWLLVVGLVGVYAPNPDEESAKADSKYPHLNDSSSAPNLVNEDSSGNEYALSEFMNEERLHESSDSGVLTYPMSLEDYDWHFVEGEEALRRLRDKTHEEKAARERFEQQRLADHWGATGQLIWSWTFQKFMKNGIKALQENVELGSTENAEEEKRKERKITEEWVRQWELITPRPSHQETNTENADREGLEEQMQAHHRAAPRQPMWKSQIQQLIRDRIRARQRNVELDSGEKAEKEKRMEEKITEERVPQWELNKPGPSHQETNTENADREGLEEQMQAHHRAAPRQPMWKSQIQQLIRDRIRARQRNVELDSGEKAEKEKRMEEKITEERVPQWELNKPGPSHQETNTENADREGLEEQMQAHHRAAPRQPMWKSQIQQLIRDRIRARQRNVELDSGEKAEKEKRMEEKITEERVPQWELNKPGPSHQETNTENADREGLEEQMQAHHSGAPERLLWNRYFQNWIRDRIQAQQREVELGLAENAENEKGKKQKTTEERVPQWELNKPDSSHLETNKEKADREGLKKQVQAHHGIPGPRAWQDSFQDWLKHRNRAEQR